MCTPDTGYCLQWRCRMAARYVMTLRSCRLASMESRPSLSAVTVRRWKQAGTDSRH